MGLYDFSPEEYLFNLNYVGENFWLDCELKNIEKRPDICGFLSHTCEDGGDIYVIIRPIHPVDAKILEQEKQFIKNYMPVIKDVLIEEIEK